MKNLYRNKPAKLLTLAACLAITACQTANSTGSDEKDLRANKIDSALERAASASANSNKSLPYLEKIYKRKPEDETAAIDYAVGLRTNDYLDRAAIVLAPFANDGAGSAVAKREFAAVNLGLGNYEEAEKYAQKAIIKDPKDYKAYQYLGIALDTQKNHEAAERAFRKGLEHWQGDPTTIMNNLALNLVSQGFLDEAVEILEKAKALSPKRLEVERNLRIARALQQSNSYTAPKPTKKPAVPVADVDKSELQE